MTAEDIRYLLDNWSAPFFVTRNETDRRKVVAHAVSAMNSRAKDFPAKQPDKDEEKDSAP